MRKWELRLQNKQSYLMRSECKLYYGLTIMRNKIGQNNLIKIINQLRNILF